MPEIRARLFQSDTQISTRYDQGVEKWISEGTALLNFESNELKQKTTLGATPVSRSGHSDSPKCYQLWSDGLYFCCSVQMVGINSIKHGSILAFSSTSGCWWHLLRWRHFWRLVINEADRVVFQCAHLLMAAQRHKAQIYSNCCNCQYGPKSAASSLETCWAMNNWGSNLVLASCN